MTIPAAGRADYALSVDDGQIAMLVARLRGRFVYGTDAVTTQEPARPITDEAADTIETLWAELKRLRSDDAST